MGRWVETFGHIYMGGHDHYKSVECHPNMHLNEFSSHNLRFWVRLWLRPIEHFHLLDRATARYFWVGILLMNNFIAWFRCGLVSSTASSVLGYWRRNIGLSENSASDDACLVVITASISSKVASLALLNNRYTSWRKLCNRSKFMMGKMMRFFHLYRLPFR